MSVEQLSQENQAEQHDELAMLKERAKLMGITFSNNISISTLREKVAAAMTGEVNTGTKEAQVNPLALAANTDPVPAPAVAPVKKKTIREHLIQTQMKLVRLRIQNLDPKKKSLPGEVLTVANEYLGTIKKFVPYGEASDDGFHVPYCLYQFMLARRFLHIHTYTDKVTKQLTVKTSWAREYSLEVMDQLDQKELNQLAAAQAAAGL